MSSFVFTSDSLDNIPVSISPPAAYLCTSFNTLLQSGKCVCITVANTFLSAATSSKDNISFNLLKNCAAIVCFSLPSTLKSITVHLECSGSMILFL